ncbi:MAG: NAD(P)/FAD-dependent oxidoreductase [Alphaproteobacteria bacterium]|nr:NAD(P)/FAD-dependent oxidoreductase [Alphaproteobacteria bacterium]
MGGSMPAKTRAAAEPAEHFDVLIAGAGISGIGLAYHLTRQCPDRTFLVLEAHESYGGTWLIHRYPGIRSDSDLHTFGYRFKPWSGPPIATAAEILAYMGEVIEENALGDHIRYRHRIVHADWSSREARWTVIAERPDGSRSTFTAGFFIGALGYYEQDKGYTPEWPGMASFRGRIVHPQTWPEDLDFAGKRVIVIGSGATAATLVPAIAGQTAHVTLVQRSPTYFKTGRNEIELATLLRERSIPEAWIHEIVRRGILHEQAKFVARAKAEPETVRDELLADVRANLPEDYDVGRHFTPRYRPWQQRIAFVPDADLFKGIAAGKASVVTDTIERFTERGLILSSGTEIEADIIVTATGFNLSVLGDIPFTVDGDPVDLSQTLTYRGFMFTGLPNLVWIFGYFRASWTLRVDLLGDLICRLLNHMKAKGARAVEVAPPEGLALKRLPWADTEDFNPNYLLRRLDRMPRRGDHPDWQHTQDYWREKDELPAIDLDGPAFVYR